MTNNLSVGKGCYRREPSNRCYSYYNCYQGKHVKLQIQNNFTFLFYQGKDQNRRQKNYTTYPSSKVNISRVNWQNMNTVLNKDKHYKKHENAKHYNFMFKSVQEFIYTLIFYSTGDDTSNGGCIDVHPSTFMLFRYHNQLRCCADCYTIHWGSQNLRRR